jgi:hypothetical protein
MKRIDVEGRKGKVSETMSGRLVHVVSVSKRDRRVTARRVTIQSLYSHYKVTAGLLSSYSGSLGLSSTEYSARKLESKRKKVPKARRAMGNRKVLTALAMVSVGCSGLQWVAVVVQPFYMIRL